MKRPSATSLIIAVMQAESRPMYLHEIREAIVQRYDEWHSESAISARMRDQVRKALAVDGLCVMRRPPEGKFAHQYWIA